jgi:hypothetical protein
LELSFEINQPVPIGFILVYLSAEIEFRGSVIMSLNKAHELARLVKDVAGEPYVSDVWIEPIYEIRELKDDASL